MNYNKVMIMGFLGADPEMRYTSGGAGITKLRIASTERWKDNNGDDQERTEWTSVTVFGKQAEACNTYLAKGSPCFVEGSLRTSSWETDEGEKRYRTEVVAQRVLFLSKPVKDEPEDEPATGKTIDVDDLPF